MKILRECNKYEVVEHWRRMDNYKTLFFRPDILCILPNAMKWYEVIIEQKDLEKIFIISSDDWKTITITFRVVDTVDSLTSGIMDEKIYDILEKKRDLENDIYSIERKLILVSPTLEGSYTIIDGNRRAVALHSVNKLVETVIYLGVSEEIKDYWWARYTK